MKSLKKKISEIFKKKKFSKVLRKNYLRSPYILS